MGDIKSLTNILSINQRVVGYALQSLSIQTQYYFRSKFYIFEIMKKQKKNNFTEVVSL